MPAAYQKLEGYVTIAANTYGLHVDAGADAFLPAGTYVWSSVAQGGIAVSLLAAIQALVVAAVPGSTVTLDDVTGRITITYGSGSRTLVWVGTALRDLMGATADFGAATSHTMPGQARALWLPDRAMSDLDGSMHSVGKAILDRRASKSDNGAAWVTDLGEHAERTVKWQGLSKGRVWLGGETLTGGYANESLQRFYRAYLRPGYTVRFYTDRTSDTSYLAGSDEMDFVLSPDATEFAPARRSKTELAWDVELPLVEYIP